jgi:ornithine cyclodeaminase/alanine dehydrogenase
MARLLTHEQVKSLVSMSDAIECMERVFREEGEGRTFLPSRLNMKTGRGWLRVGPAALEASGWMGFKAMNLVPGAGVRYQVHLYEIASGALLAIMDAQHLTTLRTGATSAVATRRLARPGAAVVALLGSGVEARAQLEAMQAEGKVRSARVFSPTAANRERLAVDFRERFGMQIVAVGGAEEAVADADLILAAVKSTEPVLLGRWLRPGTHVNSVGTARRDQREIDVEVFERSARIVVDTKEGVFGEAGDAFAARERIRIDDVDELAKLVTDEVPGRRNDSEVTLFKSVGTGLQDIAVAGLIYQRALERSVGTELGEFPYLKRN